MKKERKRTPTKQSFNCIRIQELNKLQMKKILTNFVLHFLKKLVTLDHEAYSYPSMKMYDLIKWKREADAYP